MENSFDYIPNFDNFPNQMNWTVRMKSNELLEMKLFHM